MNTVYILGAGASHDLNFRISNLDAGYGTYTHNDFSVEGPLSSGYFYYFNQILKTVKSSVSICPDVKANEKLLGYICNKHNINKAGLLDVKDISKKVNIETLYINIESAIDKIESERGGNPHDLSLLQDQEFIDLFMLCNDLKSYIFNTLSFIGYYCISKFHRTFAEHVVNTGGDVISFNWDTLLDEAMFNTKRWSYETGYGLEFEKVIYKTKNDRETVSVFKTNNNILKPHGSINWYSDTNKEKLYLIVPVWLKLRGGTFGQLKSCESIGDAHVFTHVIPPGKKRRHFSVVWQKIREILKNADEIIAIGFSFNQNDPHVKEEFGRISFKKNLSVKIVNPDSDELIQIYGEVFKTSNVERIANSFGEFSGALQNLSAID